MRRAGGCRPAFQPSDPHAVSGREDRRPALIHTAAPGTRNRPSARQARSLELLKINVIYITIGP